MPFPLPPFPWPSAALSAALVRGRRVRIEEREGLGRGARARLPFRPVDYGTRTSTDRGLYRIFETAQYRFYRTNDGSIPDPSTDTPFETSSSLPATLSTVFGDGVWHVAATYHNGIHESDLLPLGLNGETYIRLEVSGGAELPNPPKAPNQVTLEQRAGGVVAVIANYDEDFSSGLRADTWVISATYDGSTPPEDPGTPAAEVAITPSSHGVSMLEEELPAQVHGTTIKVRVQVRRVADGSGGPYWSEGSAVLETTADAQGPSAPAGGVAWRGSLPEGT